MDSQKHFQKQHSKLLFEALVKSAICAFIVASCITFIATIVIWFIGSDFWWTSFIALALLTVIITPIFYFSKFRVTAMSSARRIDRIGLKERLVTMVEYQQDDSYIAKIQREDALAKLAEVQKSQIKISVSIKQIIAASVTAAMCLSIITVTALTAAGIISSPQEIISGMLPDEPEIWISVTYEAEDGGYIDGDTDQLILPGANAERVTAVADEGFAFLEWDDGYSKPVRNDGKITSDIVYVAIFEPISEGDGDGDDGAPTDKDNGKPGKPGENGKPSDDAEEPGQTGGGKHVPNDMIIDNNQSYHEVFDGYYSEFETHMQEKEAEYSEEEREIMEGYMDIV